MKNNKQNNIENNSEILPDSAEDSLSRNESCAEDSSNMCGSAEDSLSQCDNCGEISAEINQNPDVDCKVANDDIQSLGANRKADNGETQDEIGKDDGFGATAKKGKGKRKKLGKKNAIINAVLLFFIIVLATTIIFLNVFTLCPISGGSMLPGIEDTQRVLLLRTKNAKKGDIIVFEGGSGIGDKNLIKRVMATGGDSLLFVTSTSTSQGINSRIVYLYRDSGDGFCLLDESDYILENMTYKNTEKSDFCKIFECVSPSKLFIGGKLNSDAVGTIASNNSGDDNSTDYIDYIITIPSGHYYVMGDNRDHSNDSRIASIGFVDKDDVVGRMVLAVKKDSFLEKFLMFVYHDDAQDRKTEEKLYQLN